MAYDVGDGGMLRSIGVSYDPSSSTTSKYGGDGFSAHLTYSGATTRFFLAFRGTDDVADMATDMWQGLFFPSSQFDQAVTLASEVKAVLGDVPLVVTGHSLGGALAAAGAYATGLNAIVFNPSSVGLDYRKAGMVPIRSHVIIGDILSVGRAISNGIPDPQTPNPNVRFAPGEIILHVPRHPDPFRFHYLSNFPDEAGRRPVNRFLVTVLLVALVGVLGCQPNARDVLGPRASMMSPQAFTADPRFLDASLRQALDPNYVLNSIAKRSLLFFAVTSHSPAAIDSLLAAGADIDWQGASGYTPLVEAMLGRNYNAARQLLERGADPTVKNNRGHDFVWGLKEWGSRGVRPEHRESFEAIVDELVRRGLLTRQDIVEADKPKQPAAAGKPGITVIEHAPNSEAGRAIQELDRLERDSIRRNR